MKDITFQGKTYNIDSKYNNVYFNEYNNLICRLNRSSYMVATSMDSLIEVMASANPNLFVKDFNEKLDGLRDRLIAEVKNKGKNAYDFERVYKTLKAEKQLSYKKVIGIAAPTSQSANSKQIKMQDMQK